MDETYFSRLEETIGFVQEAIENDDDGNDQGRRDRLWETAGWNMVLYSWVEGKTLNELEAVLTIELALARWWYHSVGESERGKVIGAVENLAAVLERVGGDAVELEMVDDDTLSILGSNRVSLGAKLIDWFMDQEPACNVENGHIRLAKMLNSDSVYHAGLSNDDGVKGYVWDSLGRTWEWMKSRGSFLRAGHELLALGRELEGRVLMQYAHMSVKKVALRMSLFIGGEMEGEVREEIGMTPFAYAGEFRTGVSHRLRGHYDVVVGLADLGDGMIASGSRDGSVQIWNVQEATSCTTLEVDLESECEVVALTRHKEELLVGATPTGIVIVWNFKTGERLLTLSFERVHSLLDLDGAFCLVITDQGLKLIDMAGEQVHASSVEWTVEDEFFNVCRVAGTILAFTCASGSIKLVDMSKGSIATTLNGHKAVRCIASLTTEPWWASGGADSMIRIWRDDVVMEEWNVGGEDHVTRLLALDNGMLVSGKDNGVISLWAPQSADGTGWKKVGEAQICGDHIQSLAALPGGFFATSSGGRTVLVWDSKLLLGQRRREVHPHLVDGGVNLQGQLFASCQNGNFFMWESPTDGLCSLSDWEEGSRALVDHFAPFVGGRAWTHYSNNPPRPDVVHILNGGKYHHWELRRGVFDLKVCGRYLLALDGGAISAWDLEKEEEEPYVRLLCVAGKLAEKAGDELFVICFNGELHTLDWRSRTLTRTAVQSSRGPFSSCLWLGDDQMLAVSGWRTLQLVNVSTGTIEDLIEGVFELHANLGDGTVLFTASNAELQIWDWRKREKVARLDGMEVIKVVWDQERRIVTVFGSEAPFWAAYRL